MAQENLSAVNPATESAIVAPDATQFAPPTVVDKRPKRGLLVGIRKISQLFEGCTLSEAVAIIRSVVTGVIDPTLSKEKKDLIRLIILEWGEEIVNNARIQELVKRKVKASEWFCYRKGSKVPYYFVDAYNSNGTLKSDKWFNKYVKNGTYSSISEAKKAVVDGFLLVDCTVKTFKAREASERTSKDGKKITKFMMTIGTVTRFDWKEVFSAMLAEDYLKALKVNHEEKVAKYNLWQEYKGSGFVGTFWDWKKACNK